MTAEIKVRPLGLDEVREAVAQADLEGWEPGLGDADPFYAADPDGFFAAEVEGRIVATISAVRSSPQVVFMGFYIVDPEVRGTGLGKALYDEIVSRLEGLTLGGDAVPEQVPNYETEGFEVAYWNARYSSTELGADRSPAGRPGTGQLIPATGMPFESLVEFDAATASDRGRSSSVSGSKGRTGTPWQPPTTRGGSPVSPLRGRPASGTGSGPSSPRTPEPPKR